MANNRMDLKHLPSGETFRLAKYYPSAGWYTRDITDAEKIAFVDQLNTWLDSHITDDVLNEGANYVLEYETHDPANAEVFEPEDAAAERG